MSWCGGSPAGQGVEDEADHLINIKVEITLMCPVHVVHNSLEQSNLYQIKKSFEQSKSNLYQMETCYAGHFCMYHSSNFTISEKI